MLHFCFICVILSKHKNVQHINALVAQLDRVTGYEPVGRGFESLLPYQTPYAFSRRAFVASGIKNQRKNSRGDARSIVPTLLSVVCHFPLAFAMAMGRAARLGAADWRRWKNSFSSSRRSLLFPSAKMARAFSSLLLMVACPSGPSYWWPTTRKSVRRETEERKTAPTFTARCMASFRSMDSSPVKTRDF